MPLLPRGGHRLGGDDDEGGSKQVRQMCTIAGCSILLLLIWESMFVVPVGSLGVVSVLGSIQPEPLPNGLHFVTPFVSTVNLMSVRSHVTHFADDVPTQEGVNVHLAASCISSLDPTKAVEMFRTVGGNFEEKILLPEFQATVRSVTSAHSSQELYSAQARESMNRDLLTGLQQLMEKRGIIVELTLINKLMLPASLASSIEKKMAYEQQSEQMKYVLQKERLIAEQATIRAEGIAAYQNIVASGITDKLLRWRGIESTKTLVASCNPKVVIIGNSRGKDLSIMLNEGGSSSQPGAGRQQTVTRKQQTVTRPQSDAFHPKMA
eukprot:TRINITY_DN2545_c0_g1_i1.p1 TRINITY_DN2545_c0_g1~~TRINITY_DN2545_c0_g1_i1.p1  ORF type:complete len:322 (+),score=69.22 TRINITY_DN2545_c0_g1_i1:170-1135(+)